MLAFTVLNVHTCSTPEGLCKCFHINLEPSKASQCARRVSHPVVISRNYNDNNNSNNKKKNINRIFFKPAETFSLLFILCGSLVCRGLFSRLRDAVISVMNFGRLLT